jgi:hypothetical protein
MSAGAAVDRMIANARASGNRSEGRNGRSRSESSSGSSNRSSSNSSSSTSNRSQSQQSSQRQESKPAPQRSSSNSTQQRQSSSSGSKANYPVYQRNSSQAASFRRAFAAARREGKATFEWEGRRYNTKLKGE